ncbi:hypothetical protein C7M84_013218 [Penaeus vannamei]|uniref:Uncharacterized protein n=1 Tax=Penaeus vannamei TaxID=6689 RepID=A0A423SWI9_PENVA|nr:hypothetical protein C7M84_013218 [Penaeus vannamei]
MDAWGAFREGVMHYQSGIIVWRGGEGGHVGCADVVQLDQQPARAAATDAAPVAGGSVAHLTRAATCRPPAFSESLHWRVQPLRWPLIGLTGASGPPPLSGWLARRVAGCLLGPDWSATRVVGAPACDSVYKPANLVWKSLQPQLVAEERPLLTGPPRGLLGPLINHTSPSWLDLPGFPSNGGSAGTTPPSQLTSAGASHPSP